MNEWFPGKLIVDNDASRIVDLIRERSPSLVGIDGSFQVGKTCLGKRLAHHLRWPQADLDDQIDGSGRPYVEQMKPEVLRTIVANRPVIISGVCLLAVLNLVNARPDMLVYVARITRQDLPADLDLVEEDISPERAEGRFMPREGTRPQLRAYHRQHKPISAADVIFTVPEENPLDSEGD